MLQQIATPKPRICGRSSRSLPMHHRSCADCQRSSGTRALYQMNGKWYCAACLKAWCLSLPVVQADLRVWKAREQEG